MINLIVKINSNHNESKYFSRVDITEKMTFIVMPSVILRAIISWCIFTMIRKEKNKK